MISAQEEFLILSNLYESPCKNINRPRELELFQREEHFLTGCSTIRDRLVSNVELVLLHGRDLEMCGADKLHPRPREVREVGCRGTGDRRSVAGHVLGVVRQVLCVPHHAELLFAGARELVAVEVGWPVEPELVHQFLAPVLRKHDN